MNEQVSSAVEIETFGSMTYFFPPMEVVAEHVGHEADSDIANDRVKRFGSADELLGSLENIARKNREAT